MRTFANLPMPLLTPWPSVSTTLVASMNSAHKKIFNFCVSAVSDPRHNPTHQKSKNLNPTQPNPTRPNSTRGLTQPMDNSGINGCHVVLLYYIAEIYRPRAIFLSLIVWVSSFASAQRAAEKCYSVRWCHFLTVFHCNCMHVFYSFSDILLLSNFSHFWALFGLSVSLLHACDSFVPPCHLLGCWLSARWWWWSWWLSLSRMIMIMIMIVMIMFMYYDLRSILIPIIYSCHNWCQLTTCFCDSWLNVTCWLAYDKRRNV